MLGCYYYYYLGMCHTGHDATTFTVAIAIVLCVLSLN